MAGHQCSLCSKTFSRQEHLRRHELSHSDPQFRCGTCSKAFHRKDALNKHEQIHQSDGASLLQKGARACSACAAVKSRCTGERPCGRCSSRNLECIYMASRNRHATEDPTSPDKQREDGPVLPYQSHQDQLVLTGHPADQQPPQHSPVLNQSPTLHTPLYHVPAEGAIQQAPQFTQGHNGFDPGSQFEPAAPVDWTVNGLSTINWLQSDPMSFNDDDWNTMFPMFPDEYSFSPSVDFVSPVQQFETEDSGGAGLSNALLQHSTLTPSHTLSNQQATPNADSSATGDKSTISSGEYYVDGDAGRLPKIKRRKVVSALKGADRVEEPNFSLGYIRPPIPCAEQRLHLSHEQYDQLHVMFLQLCSETSTFKTFQQTEFPSKQVLEGLLVYYFTHFDQTMPFLHASTFTAHSKHCALLLAMMALGSSYLDDDDIHVFTLSMHEFVRRYLILGEEQRFLPQETAQTLSQIHLLHAVGAGHTQYEPLFISASRSLSAATAFGRNEWARLFQKGDLEARHDDATARWRSWIQKEELLRTGFCIWMLDCLWACQFHQSPYMCLEDATTMDLPCPERAWAASTAPEWTLQVSGILNPPTLLEALQHLYVDKRLLPHLGEFSRVLLINGLYHRTWQVRTTVTQSLANFEPSAQKQASSDFQSKQPVWPPSVPLFNRWRNSACDCLDILHWSANATIGAASGMEHPTVLHLHLSRLVLLAPMQDIVRFAHYLIRSSRSFGCLSPLIPSPTEADEHRRLIQRWAVQDQYKARLSAIHAGVVFWHVRLYAINAFYEPTTLAHAALLLWALSAFSPKKSAVPSSPQDSPSPDVCDIILIDRPTDDELVQQFVRQGNSMHANMTGVGDIFGPKGPRKVLAEGQKLLGTLRSWRGVTEHWLHVLARLEKVTASLGVNTAGSRERTAAADLAHVAANGSKFSTKAGMLEKYSQICQAEGELNVLVSLLFISATIQRLSSRSRFYADTGIDDATLVLDSPDANLGDSGDRTKVSATFVVLARNRNLEGLVRSIRQAEDRFNQHYNYDWVFLNDEDFTEEFKNVTSSIVSGAAHYGIIPEEHWSIPSWIDQEKAAQVRWTMAANGVAYGDSLSYRHMCRFESGFFFRHPLLAQYDYYWRVEPDVDFFCDMPYDPFRFMQDNGKKYSFVLTFEEYVNTIETLWDSVRSFVNKYPQHISSNNSMAFLSDDGGKTYNNCHFWSNFEIGSLTWLRSQSYLDFFNHLDRAGGFFYERWGDAPVHSIAAGLLLQREEIHFFEDIGYRHYPYLHCPIDEEVRTALNCDCTPDANRNWGPETCSGRFFQLNGMKAPGS